MAIKVCLDTDLDNVTVQLNSDDKLEAVGSGSVSASLEFEQLDAPMITAWKDSTGFDYIPYKIRGTEFVVFKAAEIVPEPVREEPTFTWNSILGGEQKRYLDFNWDSPDLNLTEPVKKLFKADYNTIDTVNVEQKQLVATALTEDVFPIRIFREVANGNQEIATINDKNGSITFIAPLKHENNSDAWVTNQYNNNQATNILVTITERISTDGSNVFDMTLNLPIEAQNLVYAESNGNRSDVTYTVIIGDPSVRANHHSMNYFNSIDNDLSVKYCMINLQKPEINIKELEQELNKPFSDLTNLRFKFRVYEEETKELIKNVDIRLTLSDGQELILNPTYNVSDNYVSVLDGRETTEKSLLTYFSLTVMGHTLRDWLWVETPTSNCYPQPPMYKDINAVAWYDLNPRDEHNGLTITKYLFKVNDKVILNKGY